MIRNLEALRALAAWAVVLHHLRAPLGELWAPLGETLLFAAGVDVFFVLSGAVMVVSTSGRATDPGAFLWRRVVRIAPLYWLMTGALVAGLSLGLSPTGVSDWDRGDIVAAFTLWPDVRADGYPGPILPVGWTLTYEAGFYALFAGALFFGRAAPVVAALLVASFVVAGVVGAPDFYPARVWTSPLMLEFVGGVGLGVWWMKRRVAASLAAPALFMISVVGFIAGATALAVIAPGGDLITPGGAGATWRTLLFGAPACALVWAALCAEARGVIVGSRRVMAQGAASYAVYLMHMPIIQLVEKSGIGSTAVLVFAIAAIAVLGLAAHVLIEKPIDRAVSRRQQRPKSSSSRMMSSSSR